LRDLTLVHAWNGAQYIAIDFIIPPPVYRFHAVQDGDDASYFGQYDRALAFYQQAIFDEALEWWSLARYEYEAARHCGGGYLTLPPLPSPDADERPRLEAYSRYRILLLHTVRGYMPEAKVVYDTLQRKFPAERAGHVYAEMASVFWNDYNVSHSIRTACSRAIAYANDHSAAILNPLGAQFYGFFRPQLRAGRYLPLQIAMIQSPRHVSTQLKP
jgi:hypothetical protein